MTPSCDVRICTVISGCHSIAACSSNRRCMRRREVNSASPSEVLGRIIIIRPPHRIPVITSQTRAWAISKICWVSVTLTVLKAMMAAV
ncbi:hypothetical protein D3C81_978800 [compost metagenome]